MQWVQVRVGGGRGLTPDPPRLKVRGRGNELGESGVQLELTTKIE